jgi:hypothetical protein
MKIYVSHSSGYDYRKELYNPIKQSKLAGAHEFFFPHDGKAANTKKIIPNFDLILAEVSFPSTGQGIELGWADFSSVPIIGIYKKGCKPSSSVSFVADKITEYENADDMISKINKIVWRV